MVMGAKYLLAISFQLLKCYLKTDLSKSLARLLRNPARTQQDNRYSDIFSLENYGPDSIPVPPERVKKETVGDSLLLFFKWHVLKPK